MKSELTNSNRTDTAGKLNHRHLYCLPWTLPDNAISWLEPTAMCNLACDGCYRENEKNSHKSLDEIKHELYIFQQKRNSDCISIAGGDPLLHPQIVDIVGHIKKRGLKPIINTNGVALNPSFLKELKKAGVFGFTFHIDSKQGRGSEWRDKNEFESIGKFILKGKKFETDLFRVKDNLLSQSTFTMAV